MLITLNLAGCNTSNKNLVPVPDLRGISIEEAEQLARSKGLKVIIGEYGYFPSVAKGFVVTQTPFPFTNVKRGRTISLQVSNGPASVKMPYLVGMGFGKASEIIKKLGLYFSVIAEDPKGKDPIGIISKQEPDPGSDITIGSGIRITVSKPGMQTVPNLIDVTLEDAKYMITGSRYIVGRIIFKESKNHARGVVITQEPVPNSLAEQGSVINLTVNEKP